MREDMRSAVLVALLFLATVAHRSHADALGEVLGESDTYSLLVGARAGQPDLTYHEDDVGVDAAPAAARFELSDTHRLPLEPEEHMPMPRLPSGGASVAASARNRLRRQAPSSSLPPYRLYVSEAFKYSSHALKFDGSGYLKVDLSRVSDTSGAKVYKIHLVLNVSSADSGIVWYCEPNDRSKASLVYLQVRLAFLSFTFHLHLIGHFFMYVLYILY